MPPSTASALHPIVLPPIPVPPYFTTLGAGLLHATHPRELPSTLHTLLFSHPPLANKDRSKTWWRAQCLLYGLDAPEKRTVVELRAKLQDAILMGGLRVPDAMQETERRENGRFRKLNAEMREATGVAVAKGRAPPKDPLRGIRGADARITKPGKKSAAEDGGVTFNVTVNMHTPQVPKARARKTEPASRAKQTANWGGPAPKTARAKGPAASKEPASRAKQTAKRGGAAPKTARSKGPAAPKEPATRPKQTAGRGRGGSGAPAQAPRMSDLQVPVNDEDEDYYGSGGDYEDRALYEALRLSRLEAYGDEEEVDRKTLEARGGSGQADHEGYSPRWVQPY
ncbi:uncharacterized protein H6S33_003387 [Morchella sextelata]|uniref:uncharacterized protein n=1 Tax=Morchella sextelata TaxID=1174677 RepID=UPI001D041486|nr:uncharacterized protein H6S33_003387 [Morchella sextelata]KAH0606553.1 hypothetical protein H6S33_003387 [Morchella sextelata]